MMQMKKKGSTGMKLVPLSEKYSRTMTSASGEIVSEVRVINTKKINAARQKRLQIRRMKCTYQTTTRFQRKNEEKNNSDEATEMSFSLSYSSSSSSSSENLSENGVVLGEFVAKEESRLGERLSRVGSHGLMSVIGRRRDMEDALRVEIGFLDRGGEKYDFFGVYDGHGGPWVAEACKERLHKVLVETILENQDDNNGIAWERVMEDCFEKVDEEVNTRSLKEEMVGSTAVVAVVGKEEVVVANCGDSRAVLSRGGDVVPMSIDHKPERADELERIEGAGGRVINWNGHRVLGVLATSRSIGDQCLKPFVISKPEVTVTKRTNSDEFLILASDGLWDVVSNDVACQVVRRCFNGRLKWTSKSLDVATNKNRATTAAAVLTELAMTRGSSDNISVVVVDLRKPRSLIC